MMVKSRAAKERYRASNRDYLRARPEYNHGRYRIWYQNNKDKRFFDHIRWTFGMTKVDYDNKLYDQAGVCAICGKSPEEMHVRWKSSCKRLHIDHDHRTGKVRGLLC